MQVLPYACVAEFRSRLSSMLFALLSFSFPSHLSYYHIPAIVSLRFLSSIFSATDMESVVSSFISQWNNLS